MKLVIWDWNGTLINDVEACINSMNIILNKRGKSVIDESFYKDKFTFPVKDYYKELDFDFQIESFEELSVEYIDLYMKESKGSDLQKGSIEALEYFYLNGYNQIILSAAEQKALDYQVQEREINKYFTSILGLSNIYAKSKVDNALKYIKNSKVQFNQVTFIGDTYHDYEVAQAIGADCILVRNGHQNLSRFDFKGQIELIEDLNCIPKLEMIAKLD